MKTFVMGIIAIVGLFIFSLSYSYQKTAVVLLAYELNSLENERNTIVEKKYKLNCDYSRNTSLVKINQWAEDKKFHFPSEQNVVQIAQRPLSPDRQLKQENGVLLALVERFLGFDSRVEAHPKK